MGDRNGVLRTEVTDPGRPGAARAAPGRGHPGGLGKNAEQLRGKSLSAINRMPSPSSTHRTGAVKGDSAGPPVRRCRPRPRHRPYTGQIVSIIVSEHDSQAPVLGTDEQVMAWKMLAVALRISSNKRPPQITANRASSRCGAGDDGVVLSFARGSGGTGRSAGLNFQTGPLPQTAGVDSGMPIFLGSRANAEIHC